MVNYCWAAGNKFTALIHTFPKGNVAFATCFLTFFLFFKGFKIFFICKSFEGIFH